jgi:hypothetical protein
LKKIQIVDVSGDKHFSNLDLSMDKLQMCWFLYSSLDPFGVVGSNKAGILLGGFTTGAFLMFFHCVL